MVGPLTRQYVQQVHFSKAFIGIDGWQPETGFTGRDMMRSDVLTPCWKKSVKPLCLPTVQIWCGSSLHDGADISL
jgi:DeoR/GlpR family transcriptional regulator of sugar metabolism